MGLTAILRLQSAEAKGGRVGNPATGGTEKEENMRTVSIREIQDIVTTLRVWAEDENWSFWRSIILSIATILEKIIENPDGEK